MQAEALLKIFPGVRSLDLSRALLQTLEFGHLSSLQSLSVSAEGFRREEVLYAACDLINLTSLRFSYALVSATSLTPESVLLLDLQPHELNTLLS